MTTLCFQFPGRRYHATPWGHHVNEGLIEWPPSPWRLLRALLATGYSAGLWNGVGPDMLARGLIEKLAGVLPRYRLPAAVGAHTRHYMPLAVIEKGREATTLTFDTWAETGSGELFVSWDVELTPAETALLSKLAHSLGYLGRSESWVVARLLEPHERPFMSTTANDDFTDGTTCEPCVSTGVSELRLGYEQISLMAPVSADSYTAWRAAAIESLPSRSDIGSQRKRAGAKHTRVLELYPDDLMAALQTDPEWLRQHGWNQPPGSRRVLYWRRDNALEVGAPSPRVVRQRKKPVEAVLLSVTSATGNRGLLPTLTRTLPQAELLHRALVSRSTQHNTPPPMVLSGCDSEGRPLRGRHEHVHIWPLDLDGDGHLDHMLLWAAMGLNAEAQSAIRDVRWTFTKGAPQPLRLAIAGAGDLVDLRRLTGDIGLRLRVLLPDGAGACDWVAMTPFVPPRFPKKNGRNTLEGQIHAELASRGINATPTVTLLNPQEDDEARRFRHFVRTRRRGPAPAKDIGLRVRLHFETPVAGPLSLGYGSHFGLGVFAAIR
jgi:CRISPR-associated protein Csb2